jgi:broad specificity phosphatase PhoE
VAPAENIRRILLVRHAESTANRDKLLTGQRDVDLTLQGEGQCRSAAEFISSRYQLDLAFSSPLRRATRTAGIIAEPHGVEVIPHDLLIETDFGRWEGMDRTSLQREPEWEIYTQDPFHFTFPEGESPQDVRRRVERFRRGLLDRNDWSTVLIVSHYTPLVFYVLGIMGNGNEARASFKIENAALTVVEEAGGGEYIRMLNLLP